LTRSYQRSAVAHEETKKKGFRRRLPGRKTVILDTMKHSMLKWHMFRVFEITAAGKSERQRRGKLPILAFLA
jgi:hypothetical protein